MLQVDSCDTLKPYCRVLSTHPRFGEECWGSGGCASQRGPGAEPPIRGLGAPQKLKAFLLPKQLIFVFPCGHMTFAFYSQSEFMKYFVWRVHMCASFVMYVIFLSGMYELTKVTNSDCLDHKRLNMEKL